LEVIDVARIVVGIDGSETALEGLRWAIGEAKLRGATIDAINAWSYPYVVVPGAIVPEHPFADQAKDVAVELDDAMAAVQADADAAGVTVNPIVTEGVPSDVLCAAAEGADLLVVGSKGHRALRTLVLGSVSQDVLHRAPCPVVVIPHKKS
jgi:nucleotide-binding universal stress UspA family protein